MTGRDSVRKPFLNGAPIPKENSASDPGIITPKDVEEMVKRQGIAPIAEGDFLYAGHGNIWPPKD